jgi:hypothetical protein
MIIEIILTLVTVGCAAYCIIYTGEIYKLKSQIREMEINNIKAALANKCPVCFGQDGIASKQRSHN